MLSKCKEINQKSTFRKVLGYIQHDPRFKAVDRESDRFNFF